MEKFLVIQAARFGDLIQTKRLILSLKQKGEVVLLIDKSLSEIAKILYPFAHIYGIDFHGSPQSISLKQFNETFFCLKSLNFSMIYNCNYSHLTSAVCRIFDNDKLIGYRPAHCSQDGILRSSWSRLAFRLASNRCLTSLNLVDFWGHFVDQPLPGKAINPVAHAGGEGLGVVVSGREERRSLPSDVLAQITSVIFNLSGCKYIKLFGSNNEISKARKIIHLLPPKYHDKIINLVGKTTLLTLEEELTNLDLLITPDTGIMHLAAHKGVPVFAFFLSSASCHETGPYGFGHTVFQTSYLCSPCLESSKCHNNLQCLTPYKSHLFPKYLANIYCGKESSSKCSIEGLQSWTPDFDDLGQKLILLNGNDPASAERAVVRDIIKSFAGIYGQNLRKSVLPHKEVVELIEKFIPDNEWMLPSRRYA